MDKFLWIPIVCPRKFNGTKLSVFETAPNSHSAESCAVINNYQYRGIVDTKYRTIRCLSDY